MKSKILKILAALIFMSSLEVYSQTPALEPIVAPEQDAAKSGTNVSSKKKLKKHEKVQYRDVNLVLGIKKYIYFDFALSSKPPQQTDLSVFRVTPNRREQDPNLEKDRIELTGLKPGVTDLWIYDNNDVLKIVYNVTVTPQNLKRILGFLKREFKNVEGLKMYIRDQNIVLDGEILLPEDIARIHQVITGFENVFKIQFRLSPTLFNIVAQKMQEEIRLPDVQVDVINQRFILKGEVKSKEEFNYVVYKAALYLPKYFYLPAIGDPSGAGDLVAPAEEFRDQPIIHYFLKIVEPDAPIHKVIKIAVYFVEIAKGFENEFGFTWAPTIDTSKSGITMSYSTTPQVDDQGKTIDSFTGTITGIVNNFIPKLKDVVDHKRGRVIQSAAISVEDEAKNGGMISKYTEYPYVVQVPNSGPTTQFVQVGIAIGVTPTIIGNKETSQDINLGIDIDVGQVVAINNMGVPVSSKDKLKTYVNMKSGETAAIGGLINNSLSRNYGNAGGDANIIINLSRSKKFAKNKSQFVVFLTPTILKATSEGSEEAKSKFRIR